MFAAGSIADRAICKFPGLFTEPGGASCLSAFRARVMTSGGFL